MSTIYEAAPTLAPEAGPEATEAEGAAPATERPNGTIAGRGTLVLFTVTTFLGASLLFLVQPMVAKMLLPMLGGSAAVWNTASVFFQLALLGGYAFAHFSLRRLGTRRQPWVQAVALLVPLAFLPIGVPGGWRPPDGIAPGTWTLFVLAVMVGAPFFILSTVSPTLQRWFSATTHPHAADPYFLYAAGNVGSLLALLGYPLVLEGAMSLGDQARLWAGLYVAFVGLSLACSIVLARHRRAETEPVAAAVAHAGAAAVVADSPIDRRTRLRWVGLAAVPSALMLGVTRHLSSDVAAMPLLWVVPLALYLVTFIVAFGRKPAGPVAVSARILKLAVVPLALSFFGLSASLWLGLGLNLAVFFCAAMVAHGRLSDERPSASHLTEFYLLLSVGGVVGGALAALVAPVVFTTVLEYPITIVLALALLPRSAFARPGAKTATDSTEPADEATATTTRTFRGWERGDIVLTVGVLVLAGVAVAIRSSGTQTALTTGMLVAAIGLGGAFIAARSARGFALAIGVIMGVALLVPANATEYQSRTFFGVHRVYADKAMGNRHVLLNGTTVHGMEDTTGPFAGQPTTYYHPTGPVGQYFTALGEDPSAHQVGVIGLGSGALAWYGRSGDTFTFYEIDQAVVDIAEDPDLFTFVDDSAAQVEMVVGDGRLRLDDSDTTYDSLVIDAFSGDSIPAHLLTDEALGLYVDRLAPDGSLVFHLSNRYFDFSGVVARLAANHGLVAFANVDDPTPAETAQGKLSSTWVVMARTPAATRVAGDEAWTQMGDGAGSPLWTDDHNDLLDVFRL